MSEFLHSVYYFEPQAELQIKLLKELKSIRSAISTSKTSSACDIYEDRILRRWKTPDRHRVYQIRQRHKYRITNYAGQRLSRNKEKQAASVKAYYLAHRDTIRLQARIRTIMKREIDYEKMICCAF